MKSKEYFEKYFNDEIKNSVDDIKKVNDFLKELVNEAMDLVKKRGIKQLSSIKACFIEQEQKMNSVNRLYFKKYGKYIFKENSFIDFCKNNFPSVKYYI